MNQDIDLSKWDIWAASLSENWNLFFDIFKFKFRHYHKNLPWPESQVTFADSAETFQLQHKNIWAIYTMTTSLIEDEDLALPRMLACHRSDIINVNMIAFNVFNVLLKYYIS